MAKKGQLCATAHEEKNKFESFTQNGCYGNQLPRGRGGVLPQILDRGVPRRFLTLTLFKD